MPRAFDRRQLQLTHDPNRTGSEFHISLQMQQQAEMWKAIIEQLVANINKQLADALYKLTGIDLSTWQTLIDGLSAGLGLSGGLGQLIANLQAWADLDFDSPTFDVNAARQQFYGTVIEPLMTAVSAVINAIRPEWLGQVPLSSITNVSPNLLWNGGFTDAISLQPGSAFTYDPAEGRSTPGSARVTFNGTDLTPLWSNQVLAGPGDAITVTAHMRGQGVTVAGGNSLEAYAAAFRSDDTVITEVLLGGITTGTVWTAVTGSYTAPAETAYVAIGLKPRRFATAGTAWVDDCSVTKAPAFKIDWITGLQDRIQNLDLAGLFDASRLFNLGNIPLIDGTRVWSTENHVNGMFLKHFTNVITDFYNLTDEGDVLDPTKANVSAAQKYLRENILANTEAIRGLQTPTTGANISINFANYPNGPLPSNEFDVSYTGAGSSTVGVSAGAVTFISLNNDADRMARGRYLADKPTGDNCTLKATLKDLPQSSSGGGTPRVWGVARMSADWLNFVFIRGYCTGFLTYKCDIGCWVNGVEHVFQQGIGLDWNTSITLNFGVGGNARRYQGYSGNNKIIDYTEPSAVSLLPSAQATPANYRNIGMILEMKRGNSARTPGSLAGFSSVNT
jgi:hypothetical protein